MTTWDQMKYGPIGDAVEASLEWSEGDPIGIYAAALSMWSAALSGRVVQSNGRPVNVWTVLVGRSKTGRKGYALATARAAVGASIPEFLSKRERKGIKSGATLVTTLFEVVQDTLAAEGGVDGRVLVVEDEWASTLRTANRDATYYDQLICAWDGTALVNTIKGKGGKRQEERVDDPLLGFHGHIQPARWRKLIRSDEAYGGVFNRFLPVEVDQSKRLSSRIKSPLTNIKASPTLNRAYKWARSEPRVMELSDAAADRHDQYREELEDSLRDLPEELSCLIERADEHLLRIACVITAAERKTLITVRAWEAARAFVDYSMISVRRFAVEAEPRGRQAPKPLSDLIRETLQRYGGEATSAVLLRALGSRANAAGVKATVAEMDDVDMVRERIGGRGAPATIYRLTEAVVSVVEQSQPTPAPIVAQAVEPSVPKPIKAVVSVVEPKPIKAKKGKKLKAGKSKKAVEAKPKFSVVTGERSVSGPAPARKVPSKPEAANPFLSLL
ncbi:DUF3987 domain-containing protein [Kitasatospora sp. NPDC088556]|uniref:DUF3987 domain-containing protein n=1 Tax=Kitasatospora sp. NPDC088556 TaxID=3364076 RepID=UPI0038108C4E